MTSTDILHPRTVRFAERACGRDPIQRVLAVVAGRALATTAVEKAVRLAAAYGATLELYAAADDRESVPESWAGGSTLAQYRAVLRERRVAMLEEIAAPLRARGLDVCTTYESLLPTAEALVSHAIRSGASLVVKAVGGRPERSAADESDRVLIAQLPMPLLLVRPEPWEARPRVAAGVDPCHRAERPVELDEAVIGLCGSIAHALGGVSFAMHALEAPAHLPGDVVSEDERQGAFQRQRADVLELVRRAELDDREVRFVERRMPDGVVELAKETRPSILVIGAAARQRAGTAVGGTASEILDRTEGDLLVVKPSGFISQAMVTE